MLVLNRLTLFSIMLLTFLVGSARLEAASNPQPCYDPWVCDFAPVIGGTISGPSTPCHDETVTYRIAETKTPGQRSHCNIKEAVNATTIGWDWTLTGPELDSGSGDNFSHTFKKAGVYTVTFTGEAGVDGPTCYPDRAIVYMQVTIEDDSGTATLADTQVCPGAKAPLTWKITNTGHCPTIFNWHAYALEGDPKVALTPVSGFLTLAPGASGSGTLEVNVIADSPRGTKTIHFDVDTPVTYGVAKVTGQLAVPEPNGGIVFTGNSSGCRIVSPGVSERFQFQITNFGHCQETFDWTTTVSDQRVTLGGRPTGSQSIAPGATFKGSVVLVIPRDMPKGKITITMKLQSGGTQLDDAGTCADVKKCEASSQTFKDEIAFEFGKGYTKRAKEIIDKAFAVLKSIPGAKVTPTVPTISGKYTHLQGEECCPGKSESTLYTEDTGTAEVKAGIEIGIKLALDHIFAEKIPASFPFIGGGSIGAQVFLGAFATGKGEVAGEVTVKTHDGACNNCIVIGGKIAGAIELALSGGAKVAGKWIAADGHEIFDLSQEATVNGSIKGTIVSAKGNTYAGSQCTRTSNATICTGPIVAAFGIKIKIIRFSYTLKTEVNLIDEHCL